MIPIFSKLVANIVYVVLLLLLLPFVVVLFPIGVVLGSVHGFEWLLRGYNAGGKARHWVRNRSVIGRKDRG